MIKKLYNEFSKNIRVMFRNWTSLSLLIIMPLALILLIGYAFSSEDVTGINIGVVSESNIDLVPLAKNVSGYASIKKFESKEDCLSYLVLEKVHICLFVEGVEFGEKNITSIEDIPSGKITYYYDNSRTKI